MFWKKKSKEKRAGAPKLKWRVDFLNGGISTDFAGCKLVIKRDGYHWLFLCGKNPKDNIILARASPHLHEAIAEAEEWHYTNSMTIQPSEEQEPTEPPS